MKRFFKIVGLLLLALILIGAGTYAWASMATSRTLARTIETHTVDFPIPFPLSDAEVAEIAAERVAAGEPEPSAPELEAIALERAIERGRHLVEARYGCIECHGEDFGGGVMVDAFPIGTLLGPNLTSGSGSVTAGYTAADWDRIVRHGVGRGGRPTAMPSQDFQLMSDQELSDVIVYIDSHPPVNNAVAPVSLGPLGKILVATGEIRLSVDEIGSHDAPHEAYPPAAAANVEFGRHLIGTCTGCHSPSLAGGPIAGGDPSWPPAANLTPHADGLAEWSYDDFVALMRRGALPGGGTVGMPMAGVVPFGQRMTDVELEAMWMYLRSVPPAPTPQ